jgi:hypothetical protein
MPTRFIAGLLGRQICLASDLCTIALKTGQWTWAKVPQGKNCHVDLRGKYADGKSADMSNIDICADKTVDLVN